METTAHYEFHLAYVYTFWLTMRELNEVIRTMTIWENTSVGYNGASYMARRDSNSEDNYGKLTSINVEVAKRSWLDKKEMLVAHMLNKFKNILNTQSSNCRAHKERKMSLSHD